jgi:drug/metabolite transporter (DMT)-like permease
MEKQSKIPFYIFLYAVVAMLFWGMSFIWTDIVFEYYHPITTIFLRLVISSCFLFIVILLGGRLQRIKKEHLLLLFASALFNPFFYFLGENFGLKLSTPAISAVVIAMIPLFTPVAAWLLIKEKLPILNIFGILVSFGGIVLMLINPGYSISANPLGILFLFGAVVSAVIYSILLKKLTEYYAALSIIAWQNLLGVFLFLPLFLIFEYDSFIQVEPDSKLLWALFALAILASSISYILFTTTIKHLGVSRANVYSNLIPVITAIAAFYLRDELFTAGKIAGIAIVISGVIMTQLGGKRYTVGSRR